MKSPFLVTALAAVAAVTVSARGDTTDPFQYFNVYSLGDIGSPESPYGSDFQGVAGAGGNAYFSSFSLHATGSPTGYGLHTGGSARLSGAYFGGIEAGGDVELGNVSVTGNVVAGGGIRNFAGGTVGGDALAAGAVDLDGSMTVMGSKGPGSAFQPQVNHAELADYFLSTSEQIGFMADTGTVTDDWGNLIFQGTSGVNVVTVDAATLKDAWAFSIDAPEDAVVYVNVLDQDVDLDWTGWRLTGGIGSDDVLLNMPFAHSLDLTSTNAVNLLAPMAQTRFDSGLLAGTLIVGDLQGGGQVNHGDFGHGGPVPEPAGAALLAVGSVLLLSRRRRRATA